ncbi:MAG: hypothetical protein II328_00140 [Clostridia bacterium]|nr:hypothetical protein [Clostridia bacterium]
MRLSRTLRLSVLFALFGTLMFLSDLLMEALPNVHLVGALIVSLSRVYRAKALIPLYVYVCLTGLFYGFGLWWIPYLYVWLPLWGAAMLVPKNLSDRKARFVLPLVAAAHGLLFGVLYAPAQAILFGMSFERMLLWVGAGLYFDLIHAAGNLVLGTLVVPLSRLLQRLEDKASI